MRKATALAAIWVAVLFALVPSVAASAAPATKCVGLVVDSGQGSKTGCVSYQSGMTGADLLKKTGHKVGYESNGLLCQIDSYPSACKSDNTHYWSYYIRPAGKAAWTYASKGPTTEKAQPGETEAFVYQNGKSRKPGAISYATLAKSDKPATAATKKKSDGGSNTGLIVGIVIAVVIVAGAAGTFTLRRRRAA
jgi:hypothetical protein